MIDFIEKSDKIRKKQEMNIQTMNLVKKQTLQYANLREVDKLKDQKTRINNIVRRSQERASLNRPKQVNFENLKVLSKLKYDGDAGISQK